MNYGFICQNHLNQLQLSIYAVNGQQLFQQSYRNSDKVYLQPELPSGIYMIQLQTEEGFTKHLRWIKK